VRGRRTRPALPSGAPRASGAACRASYQSFFLFARVVGLKKEPQYRY
jgi:hypothetical protein